MAFITRLSLRLGVVVFLGVALLFGAGIYAATQVQQDLLPDISVPAVIVITPYPGASPQIVDQQVSVPVGNALQGVAGANTVQATSSQGASLVIVLFKDGRPYDENSPLAAEHLQGKDVDLAVHLGAGSASSTVWTCDLSAEYVRINADYRT